MRLIDIEEFTIVYYPNIDVWVFYADKSLKKELANVTSFDVYNSRTSETRTFHKEARTIDRVWNIYENSSPYKSIDGFKFFAWDKKLTQQKTNWVIASFTEEAEHDRIDLAHIKEYNVQIIED